MLKTRHGGLGGPVAWRKLLKAQGVAFFLNYKKTGVIVGRRSETRSDGFVHTISIQFFEVNLGSPSRVAVPLSVSHTLPSGMFTYGPVRGG